MMFPACSKTKIFVIRQNIGIVDKSDKEPMFDLILGIEPFATFGKILDFQEHAIHN